MEKEELIKKCHDILRRFNTPELFDRCIDEILQSGCIDLNNCPQNYIPAYWVMGALFERAANQCLNGSVYDRERRKARKEANNIKCFIPSWF